MQIKTSIEFQTFNDGVCAIYEIGNIAEAGNKPKEGLKTKISRAPYERRKVGITRFYTAKQANVKVEDVLRIPYNDQISTQDVCMIGEIQFAIKQVQHIYDTMPKSTDLTLQRLEDVYDIARIS